jgi:Na+-driven multidrug efflux pump
MMIITIFQATGRKLQPTILSLVRKGGIDIPIMVVMYSIMDSEALSHAIPWATPISDATAMLLALALFIPYWIKLRNLMKEAEALASKEQYSA